MPAVLWKRKVRERKLSSGAESRRREERPRVTKNNEALICE